MRPPNNSRILIAFTAMIAVIAIPSHGLAERQTPRIALPKRIVPTPNAYDTYIRAAKELKRDDPDKEYELAINRPEMSRRAVPPIHVYTTAEKVVVLHRCRPALDLIRRGLSQTYLNMTPSMAPLDGPLTPGDLRKFARLLTLDAQVHSERGEWSAAIQSDLDAIELGEIAPRGGDILLFLTGFAMENLVRKNAADCVGHLNAQEAKGAALRLTQIQSRHVPAVHILDQEKWNTLSAVTTKVFPDPNWRKGMPKTAQGETTPLTQREWVARYTRFMDRAIAEAAHSYRRSVINSQKPDPLVLWGEDLIPQYRFLDAEIQTQNSLIEAALAIQSYHAKYGNYPRKLQQLSPGVVSKMPMDPFHEGRPLSYHLTPTGYLLYSIGPDGKDDNGTPISAKDKAMGVKPFHVEPTSQGDIVAGVNK